MLYLVTGYWTEHREGDPEVIYCGCSAEAAEAAVTLAPADFLRVERAMVIDSYKVRSGVVEVPVAVIIGQPASPAPAPVSLEFNDGPDAPPAPAKSPRRHH